jgi:hypothetical protein
MDPKTHDISGLSQTCVSLMNSRENQQTFHRRPVEPMIAAVKIDRAPSDIEAQIGNLRRYRVIMELVRMQLANMEAKWAL